VKNPNKTYPITGDISVGDLAEDGSQLRPFIVWFEEEVPMIAVAARIVRQADIFVVIGTSLQVYPAAGLVNYAPYQIPKYIIDKKIPSADSIYNPIMIEKPAGEEVKELSKLLVMSYKLYVISYTL